MTPATAVLLLFAFSVPSLPKICFLHGFTSQGCECVYYTIRSARGTWRRTLSVSRPASVPHPVRLSVNLQHTFLGGVEGGQHWRGCDLPFHCIVSALLGPVPYQTLPCQTSFGGVSSCHHGHPQPTSLWLRIQSQRCQRRRRSHLLCLQMTRLSFSEIPRCSI